MADPNYDPGPGYEFVGQRGWIRRNGNGKAKQPITGITFEEWAIDHREELIKTEAAMKRLLEENPVIYSFLKLFNEKVKFRLFRLKETILSTDKSLDTIKGEHSALHFLHSEINKMLKLEKKEGDANV